MKKKFCPIICRTVYIREGFNRIADKEKREKFVCCEKGRECGGDYSGCCVL